MNPHYCIQFQINDDKPRRVFEAFDVKYVNIAKSESIYVVRHCFMEQDLRPIYAWPEHNMDGRSNRQRRIQAAIQAQLKAEAAAKAANEINADGSVDADEESSHAMRRNSSESLK